MRRSYFLVVLLLVACGKSDDAVTDTRDPSMITFQASAAYLHKQAIDAVRASLARHHHFDPRDEKATPAWDTIEEDVDGFVADLKRLLIDAPKEVSVGGADHRKL